MDFTRLTEYLDSLPGIGVPGLDLIVCQDGARIYRHMAGTRDAARTEPVRGDETYRLYSCTKLFTTCAAMQLIERGKLHLDDPVSDYLPAYAHLTVKEGEGSRPARRVMTVRHLMSMQSGLNYDTNTPAVREVMERTGGKATTRELMEAKAADPLEFDPGEDFLYSLSHDALAAVVEVASGLRFSEYLKKNIWDPLGMKTVSFDLTDALYRRMAMQYHYNEHTGDFEPEPVDPANYRRSPNYESGGGGLIGDVEDMGRFVNALACGGSGLLSPEMLQLWSANQLGPRSRRTFDAWKRVGYSYGLGVRTRVSTASGGAGQLGEFGWDGAAGAWEMVDPHNRLSAFFAINVLNYVYVYEVIHPTIRSLIYEGLRA